MKLTIKGHSDDIVMITGEIHDEFYPGENKKSYLAFGDGTVLSISYDGEWTIKRKVEGSATFTKVDAKGGESSDEVTLEGEIGWVLFGCEFKMK